MRSHEQRIAEIDRRSNEIFQKRKEVRRQLLTACIPVVLCAGLCFLLIPPSTVPSDSITPSAVTGNLPGHKNHNSIISTITQIEITCAGQARICTDPSEIQSINALLILCTNDTERGNSTADVPSGNAPAYTITLTMRDGTHTRYYLENSTLTQQNNNCVYALTQTQADNLRSLLSFSDS